MRGRLLVVVAATVVAAPPMDVHAEAGTPPPRWERLAELVTPTVRVLEQLRDGGTAAIPDHRVLARCAERATAAVAACVRGVRPAALGCAARLVATAIALDAVADRSTDAGLWTAFVASETARLAALLGTLERSRDECVDPQPDDPVPAILGWRAGGTLLEVEPARPLSTGGRHRLVFDPPLDVERIEPALDADGRLRGDPAPRATLQPIADYGRRVLREAAGPNGVTTRPALLLRLARPIALGAVVRMAAAFHAIDAADDDASGIVVTTVDDGMPAGAPPTPASPPIVTSLVEPGERTALGLDTPMLARAVVRRGTFPSRDPTTGTVRQLPYLVALPAVRSQPRVAVLLLDGLGGTATGFLRIRGASLLARGLTLVAMDLPTHGMRDDGTPFLDAKDPTVLAGNLATGIADVVAFRAHLQSAGAIAPGIDPPSTIRVLAYSIGASVASVALALDPTLGAAVLIAPPGDLTDFLSLATSAAFGEPLLRCLAGAELGGACDGGTCPNGTCVPNPQLLPILDFRMAVRTLFAAVDPQTRARAIAGTNASRPVLLQIGGQDGIVAPDCTIWLAAAAGADLTCRRRADRPQTICRFPNAGHNVVWDPDARRQADAFIVSDGATLAPSGDAWGAR